MMVETRRNNGTYIRTEEQNRKLSETLKKIYENPEVRTARSEILKKVYEANPEIIKRRNETLLKKEHVHWTKTKIGKEKLSSLKKGQVLSARARAKMSISASKRIRTRQESTYTFGKGGFREDIGIYVRSMWEANFARILTFQSKTWEYEPKTFQITPNCSYTPDFLVENVFYELKGRVSTKSLEKMNAFKQAFPDIELIFIGPAEWSELRNKFKRYVPNWEGR